MLEIGDIYTYNAGRHRLVYLGDSRADLETYIPERSATGGLTNSGRGKWIVDPAYPGHRNIKLTAQQIEAWLRSSQAPHRR